ncbi:uncharacterized protein LOC108674399 isoform X2 [Hyalella azteca]|uniref:Uncharacterized protein LOC108674399 isoform X2 n=1 Tax=Hyalella azteca TaxID=294128 RepID=A0A8B7NVS0_HYAAZ|nr:uncharacterized protein LOC108674399 isoform X2 [Hyalella azteca]
MEVADEHLSKPDDSNVNSKNLDNSQSISCNEKSLITDEDESKNTNGSVILNCSNGNKLIEEPSASNSLYSDGTVVWVRLGQSWWPGTVVALHLCPQDFLGDLKRTPLAVVKFFDENEFVDIHKPEHVYPYNCDRKNEFIKKGLNLRSMKSKEELFKKFEQDVLKAEQLTGGGADVFTRIEEDSNKRRIDYSNLGFGPPKPKKKKEERIGDSDISEAVHYKKNSTGALSQRVMKLEHKVVIMEQPHVKNMKEDLQKSCNHFKCNLCDFTCSRLGVIIWHNKGHLKTVIDYDRGIRMPGRKRRKPKSKSKKVEGKAIDGIAVDHSKVNGHAGAGAAASVDSKQLLLDWDDEDEAAGESGGAGEGNHEGESSDEVLESEDESGAMYRRPPADLAQRRPMRAAEELNSAFDALLADSQSSGSISTSMHNEHSFVNNDSDSDASDWEKYYDKDSDGEENDEPKESDIKSLCEATDDSNGVVSSTITNGKLPDEKSAANEPHIAIVRPNSHVIDSVSSHSNSASPEQSNQDDTMEAGDEDEDGDTQETGRSSSLSSSPSNSGPAFMLVAVDAQGNNVPMPALTDRNHSSNLVAVEASMEDGTSRTLYIDPAYLEPNVDLTNLMLHIDYSGQETVIIPSTSAVDTTANASLPQDSLSCAESSACEVSSGQPAGSISSAESTRPLPAEHKEEVSSSGSAAHETSAYNKQP